MEETDYDDILQSYIFLQLCTGGDLFSYIVNHKDPESRLYEGEAKYIMYQLILGLTYLHDKQISHRGELVFSRFALTASYFSDEDLKVRTCTNMNHDSHSVCSQRIYSYMRRDHILASSWLTLDLPDGAPMRRPSMFVGQYPIYLRKASWRSRTRISAMSVCQPIAGVPVLSYISCSRQFLSAPPISCP